MKIIFLLDQLGQGGIASTYVRWSEELVNHGHEVTIYCQKQSSTFTDKIPAGVTIHANNSGRAIAASPHLYRFLRRQPKGTILVAGGFTLIYAQALKPRSMPLWAYTPSSPGLGSKMNTHQSRLLEDIRYGLMRRATRKAALVTAVSNGTARNVEEWANLPTNSVQTLYNPAFTEAFLNADKLAVPHAWMKDDTLKVFTTIGRLEATKNHLLLLEAFHKLHAKHPETRLLIGGEGRLRPLLTTFIQSHFTKPYPVELLGVVKNPQAYMAHAHAYVSSSQLEAFGNVLVEALATGTQVIATDAPFGPAEILTKPEYGTLVKMNDAKALTQAMAASLKQSSSTNKRTRQAYAQTFSAKALWPNMENILKTFTATPLPALIVQRVVASYRVPLFEALAKKYGWHVASASNFPQAKAMNAVTTAPWLTLFPYTFFGNPYRCHVPLNRIIKTLKPRVLVLEAGTQMTSTWLSLAFWPMIHRIARFAGYRLPKLVLWGHGAPVAFGASPFRKRIFTWVRTWMLNQADGYLTYTKEEAAYLQALAPRAKIGYVTNTIDILPILKLRTTAHEKTKAAHILMVGRITPDKKFAEAIEAMPHIWKQIPHAELTIIGAGEGLAHLKELAGTELSKRIHLPGAIYEEAELATYYNRSQIFWLMGAAGLGINHTLAYGLPVLAYGTDLPGGPRHHPEVYYVQHAVNGWLVQDSSLEAMVTALTSLLKNAKTPRQQLGKKLEDFASKNLGLDQAVTAMHTFITEVDNT